MVVVVADEHEVISPPDAASWRQWLEANHDSEVAVWLQIAKAGAEQPTVTYSQALEEALCFGWIDGQKAKGPTGYWRQRFSRRNTTSKWSKRNRALAEALVRSKRMDSSGLAEIKRAKVDGRWQAAYDGQASAEVPGDLAKALAAAPKAQQAFDQLDRHNRFKILYRIADAKRESTRASRIVEFVEMLATGQTPFPK